MIYIVQHPMNGSLLGADRRSFIYPGTSGDAWSTSSEDDARRLAEVVGGKIVPVAEPPAFPRMPMPETPKAKHPRAIEGLVIGPRPAPAVKVSV